jgi:lipopolysaccharide/colanic/teichoic acid biosynthesis glycosyltransferase
MSDRMSMETSAAEETAWKPGALPDEPVLLEVGDRSVDGRALARAAKRAFDIAFSALTLTLLAPLWLLLALAIRLDSPGPVLFRSPRIGQGGEPLEMLKFRTMVDGADRHLEELRPRNDAGNGVFKMRNDPRLTRIGRFLRSTSLDEVPQLLHVLTGEMSVVGPRPLPPDGEALIEGGGRRLPMRPGITGLWQVSGKQMISLDERVALEDEYLRTWTLRGDGVILLKSIAHVVRRRGI